jgi:hypothetical protein
VVRLVLREAVPLVVCGAAAGMPVALVSSRLLDGLLFGVGSRDPVTFALAPAALLVVALCACLVPAFRAAAVDPAETIRED